LYLSEFVMMRRLCLPSLLLASFALSAGCSKDKNQEVQLPTSPARGIVTYKGKPVANASVGFISLDNKVRAGGRTDGVGSFVLSTYGQQDGAPPGKYRVTVAVSNVKEIEPGVLEPEPEGGFKSPIPTKYANPSTTDILVEITEGGKNDFTIDLK
jgi:hypothetical protein